MLRKLLPPMSSQIRISQTVDFTKMELATLFSRAEQAKSL